MRATATRRVLCAATAVLLGLSVAGCSGSSKSKPGTFASTLPSATGASGTLTKTEFLNKMNSVCAAIDTERKVLPTPSGPTDYANIAANLSGTLRLLPAFIAQADALVQRSPDKVELNAKWLSIEKADFAAVKPLAEKMVADSDAKDATKVPADGEALSGAPDHSATIADYMTSYGLTECATLESQ
ncbi:MAG: hypothetical protein M3Y42_09725 [Actinomycetota bacterium]|nr:hypothetical protein [Actinomycetota bacterium]